MARLNQVNLIGYVGRTPDFKTFNNGNAYIILNVGTDDSYTNRETNEKVDRTDWHRIVLYGEKLCQTVRTLSDKVDPVNGLKGTQVYIEGKLRTRSYEVNGAKKYTTEVVVTQHEGFQLLGKKPATTSTNGTAETAPAPADTTAAPAENAGDGAGIPF
ncbi:MAG: single-stranded DNA-binding protein [Parvularculales bacterium]